MTPLPTATVLIPARNEETDIERCLRAVLAQDHPHDRMEVVLADGGSTDRTVELATRVLEAGDIDWRIVENLTGTTPSNLNAGLAAATGEIVCRVDARSIVPPEYVRCCVEILGTRPGVVGTGGAQVAVPRADSIRSRGIARALNNRYAMGGSRYRSGSSISGASDTVYLGAYRRHQLVAADGWDDAMLTNQDYDLNRRLGNQGTIWFDGRLTVGYTPRATLVELWRQYHRFGRWKVVYWRHTGDRPQRRQLLPLLALPLLVVTALRAGTRGRGWPAVLVAATGAMAVDGLGSGGRPATLPVRAVSAVSIVIVVSGWVAGVFVEGLWKSSTLRSGR